MLYSLTPGINHQNKCERKPAGLYLFSMSCSHVVRSLEKLPRYLLSLSVSCIRGLTVGTLECLSIAMWVVLSTQSVDRHRLQQASRECEQKKKKETRSPWHPDSSRLFYRNWQAKSAKSWRKHHQHKFPKQTLSLFGWVTMQGGEDTIPTVWQARAQDQLWKSCSWLTPYP